VTEERKTELLRRIADFRSRINDYARQMSQTEDGTAWLNLQMFPGSNDDWFVTMLPVSSEIALLDERVALRFYVNGYDDVRTNLAGHSFLNLSSDVSSDDAMFLIAVRRWINRKVSPNV
jgi:hypothetical protein